MPRARSKTDLLSFSEEEFSQLLEHVARLKQNDLLKKKVFENRTPKDILAHLAAWHELMLDWYTVGMKGEKPEIPAPGYTFKTAPELNEKLFQEWKNESLETVLKKLKSTHKKLLSIVEKHTDDELFTKKKYDWTGSTSMGSYFASALSSHYVWANDLLKKVSG